MTTAYLDRDSAALRMQRAASRPVRAPAGDSARAELAEQRLSMFWQEHYDSGERLRHSLVRRPRAAARAVADVRALPQVVAELSDSDAGRRLREQLQRRVLGRWTVAGSGACLLSLPAIAGAYQEGPRRQTLRRKVRAAQRRGVITREVTDLAEQRDLGAQLAAALRSKTDERYRDEADQSFLVGRGLWTVAQGTDGTPLVIAVTPIDGTWALLLRFISLGDTPEHSDARYLLTAAVVERLRSEGVRHLVDTRAPAELPNGLRHFQRMLGFRIARVRVTTAG